jgi:putative ABC transport system permease protein
MVFTELLRIALGALWANKLRSGLTTLGNIIGVLTVIAVVSILQGMNRYVTSQITEHGSDLFYIDKYGMITSEEEFFDALHRKDITVEDAQAIKERCPSVGAVASISTISGTVRYRNQVLRNVTLEGEMGDFQQIIDIPIDEGRFPTPEDDEHRRFVAAIGSDIKDNLFGLVDPMGRTIKVKNIEVQVIGIAKRKGPFFGQSQDDFVVVPMSIFQQYLSGRLGRYFSSYSVTILAKPKEQKLLEAAQDEATLVMRARRHVQPGKPNDFGIMTSQTFVDLYNNFTRVAWIVMVGIASISLVVGGIVIMNIMLVSVTERTREIGVRKAIGARQGDILKQFLVEAATLGGLGGLIGVALGILVAKIVSLTTPLPSAVELWSILAGLFVAFSVGIVFGLYPAWKAAKMDPIVALRYE